MKRQFAADAQRSRDQFERRLKNNQIAPLYLFEGRETYLRDQALQRLAAAAVNPALRDFNFTAISVTPGNLDEALALARQLPMMSARRLVVVTGFEAINDERQLEVFQDYLRAPVETTVLVFVSDALDNRRNLAVMLRKFCEVVSFDPLDDGAIAARIRDYVSAQGCVMDGATAAYLVGTTGADMRRLTNEADKLINYVGGRGVITRAEVDELVRHAREHSNFELTDALLAGERRRALALLERIFANASEAPSSLALMILGALASNYRRLLMARELMRQNASFEEVAKAIGRPAGVVMKMNEQLRRLPATRLTEALARIAAVDVALKTSLAKPRAQLEVLICELCR